jgi:rhodanese-related sulfurtransferase
VTASVQIYPSNRSAIRSITAEEVREALMARREIALLDVREEALHAEGHPLFAANLSLSRIEIDAHTRLPRRTVPIVLFDAGEGYAGIAAARLAAMGYSNVSVFDGGLDGWRNAGFEIFRDVNSPSKAFGELVEARRHTPSLSAQEVRALIEAHADIVIVDARRYEEFQTMSIPTAISAPGGELVLRLQELAEHPSTQIIVNCAGRTRSIIGTQSLINAGLPNRVAALRNGTIGWKLAQQPLDHGVTSSLPAPSPVMKMRAAIAARRVADAAGVKRVSSEEVNAWRLAADRTFYLFDVRTPEEYRAGHLSGFRSAPGGQLVQETDMFAPVRGARIVVMDDDGVRANMTASWLAQMNWEVYVLNKVLLENFNLWEEKVETPKLPNVPPTSRILAATLHQWLESTSPQKSTEFAILDFSPSRVYLKAHIPGAWFALRSRIHEALATLDAYSSFVVTSQEIGAAHFAWADLAASTQKPVYLLEGNINFWQSLGYPIQNTDPGFASQPVDYYRRPYEGTDASSCSMQAYLDWEFGLVEQLERDGTHGFWVLET